MYHSLQKPTAMNTLRRYLLALALLMGTASTQCFAQDTIDNNKEEEIFITYETMPEYPDGQKALTDYLVINYKPVRKECGIRGRAIIQFVVEEDGSISNVIVARGVDPVLDQEAIKLVENMPKWKPGTMRGVPTRMKYTVPVKMLPIE